MEKWDPALVRLQEESADVATTVDGLNDRAQEVLEALGRILPFDAGWLAVRDPERRRHVPLAATGAADPLRRYFQSPGADAEVEASGSMPSSVRCWPASCPFRSPRYVPGASTCLRPASTAEWPGR